MAMLTHAGFAWAPGGFVGVSLFFTMSGFLITTLLLRPVPSGPELADFLVRRFRRLLPPVVLLIGGVLLLSLLVDLGPTPAEVRSDAMASLLYVANWRFLFTGNTYEAIFTAPSPFHHMWSLAIEEQFYVVFPIVVFVLRGAGLSVRRLGHVVAALWILAIGANLWTGAVHGVQATYLASQSRLSEILAGAVLATLVPGLLDRGRPVAAAPVRRIVLAAALVGAVVNVGLFLTVHDTDPLIARGILPVVSIASVAIVAGVVVVPTFARAVAWGPLPAVGRMSYGLYLFHWPIFVWLTPARTGLDAGPLLVVRVVVTAALAGLSYRFVETPIRRGVWPRTRRQVAVPAAGVLIAIGVLLLVPPGRTGSVVDAAEAELETLLARPEPVATASSVRPEPEGRDVAPPRPVVASMFGDSTAFFTQLGLARWASENPDDLRMVEGSTEIGCPLARGGLRVFDRGEVAPAAECDWTTRWPMLVATHRPDVAVVQVGPWEVADYRPSPDHEWTQIGDPAHDAFLRAELTDAVDRLSEGAGHVVLLTSPEVEVGLLDLDRSAAAIRASEGERMRRFNRLLGEVADSDDRVSVVDLAGHVASISTGRVDQSVLPDGVHFTGDTAERIAQWLGQEIVGIADE